ncbi:HD domain-containing phosphohydrolase [Helicovermis profundi]|uniref:HD-GYP domain-containing protein n=1 Tax=Helicovermis profundi TaxID=3065157 RepID=A0AAU9EJM5_9FIRM|nr:hypothetical protein HLPR_04850 [Clostridia bacterium S502]
MKLKSKLIVIAIVILFILTAVAYKGISSINKANNNLNTFYEDRYIPNQILTDIQKQVFYMELNLQKMVYEKKSSLTVDDSNAEWKAIAESIQLINRLIKEYKNKYLVSDEVQVLKKVEILSTEYENILNEIFYYREYKGADILISKIEWLTKLSENYINELETINIDIAKKLKNDSNASAVKSRNVLLFLLFIVSIILLILFILIDKFTKRRISLEKKISEESISIVSNILEMHDEYTEGHSKSVANISRLIAEKLDCKDCENDYIYIAGLLHDIGKTFIGVDILNKKGKLNDEEYDEVKMHTIKGHDILIRTSELKVISKYVLHHHERWDGKGYPSGLKKSEIPYVSRILAVADTYDAMTSNRSYRQKLSKKEALDEIVKNAWTQFDPNVVNAFIKVCADQMI